MIGLSNCPFCGCDSATLNGSDGDAFWIECQVCGASTKHFPDYDKTGDIDDGYDALRLARNAWNLRNNNHE